MTNVTIINAYGDKNIGDAAILKIAVDFIRIAYHNKCNISVLCENIDSISSVTKNNLVTAYQLPYGYAIGGKTKGRPLTKIFRFGSIYIISILFLILNRFVNIKLPHTALFSYIAAIKHADIIIGMGGGYLTTNTTKDYFGLLLTLLPIYIAKIYHKKIVFLPMSFGPFFSVDQQVLSYQALKNTTVIARDQITLKALEKLDTTNKINLFYAPDLAL